MCYMNLIICKQYLCIISTVSFEFFIHFIVCVICFKINISHIFRKIFLYRVLVIYLKFENTKKCIINGEAIHNNVCRPCHGLLLVSS